MPLVYFWWYGMQMSVRMNLWLLSKIQVSAMTRCPLT